MKKKVIMLATLGSLIAPLAFAAVDTDVQNAASAVATTIQDNVMAALTTNIPVVILAGVFILSVGVIWRLGKRFTR